MKQASRKVPDGKMVELGIETEEGEVVNAEIRGDFFLQPPEKLSDLENKLEGLNRKTDRKEVIRKLETVEAELIGFSRKDIAEVFTEAAGDGK